MSDLLMIVPSRGRPENIRALLEAWHRTRTHRTVHLLVAIDDDDPTQQDYRDVFEAIPTVGAEICVGPRIRMNPTLNKYAVGRADQHFAVGFMGDDHRPRTKGWDSAFIHALREMGSGLVYGNDLIQGANLPTAVAMTSDIVKALGYFAPPAQMHLYLDNFWLTLGEALGRLRYLDDVVIEHVHPVGGKVAWDPGYAEVNAQEVYDADREAFKEWLHNDMDAAVERVEAAIRLCV